MPRMSIVGCEASGKTVFMAALADYYSPASTSHSPLCLVPENQAANRFAAFQRRQMRSLRQWPPATNPTRTVALAWTLRSGGETLAEISMLEFGGETFRAAFRDEEGGAADAMYRMGVECWNSRTNDAAQVGKANEWFRRAKSAGLSDPSLDDWTKATSR